MDHFYILRHIERRPQAGCGESGGTSDTVQPQMGCF